MSSSSCSAATAPAPIRAEIEEGLEIVREQLTARTVRAGEEELFKARARETRLGQDHRHRHRPARRQDRLATSRPCRACSSTTCASTTELVREHERMLTGGFYAEIDLDYDAVDRPGEERPAVRRSLSLRPDPAVQARRAGRRSPRAGARSPPREWKDFLLRSVGLEPTHAEPRAQRRAAAAHGPVRRAQLQHGRAGAARHRQVPPVPAGLALRPPRLRRQGDRRADVRQQRERPARPGLPVRRRLLRRGLRRLLRPEGRRQHHEGLHGVRRVQPRARRASAPTAASCMVGNFDVDVQHQQRVGHLFGPLPPEMRNDTAFMDRIHCLPARLGRPEAQPRAVHRPLRPGQRLPRRVLDAAARRRAAFGALQGRVHLRRRAERAATRTPSTRRSAAC